MDGGSSSAATASFLLHPRSHSLCSNLLNAGGGGTRSASTSMANHQHQQQQQQSLASLYVPSPHHQQQQHYQQTLVGIEALNNHFEGGQQQQHQHQMTVGGGGGGRRLEGTGAGGHHFVGGRRVSRQQQQDIQRLQHLSGSWLEKVFQRRECIKFIPADNHSDRCGCGRVSAAHSQLALSRFTSSVVTSRGRGQFFDSANHVQGGHQWTIGGCTAGSATDAYGTIEFQGSTHVHKARYIRLGFDSDPGDVMSLMERVWGLERPRLVISVHGGTADFRVPEQLGRVFREGLLKAAETTGAWVLTSGLDSGVVKHVARALDEAGISARMRSRIVTVGIAPWGLLQGRDQLVGLNAHISYDRPCPWAAAATATMTGSPGMADNDQQEHGGVGTTGLALLNDRHSYFLLADNGTVGRYGADIVLRRRLEQFLARRTGQIGDGSDGTGANDQQPHQGIPIICVALEGGLCTLNSIDHQYLHGQPPVPVVICEGSGRISDLLALAEQHLDSQGKLPANVRAKLLAGLSQLTCHSGLHSLVPAQALLDRIVRCAGHRNKLLTVFRIRRHHHHQHQQQMDRVILRALLHGQNQSPVDQLLLTLAWGREDIARSEIFQQIGQRSSNLKNTRIILDPDWLNRPMMEALLLGSVPFVRLFLEQGLSPKRFLTFERLEQLYNVCPSLGPLLMAGKHQRHSQSGNSSRSRHRRHLLFTLPEIGLAIERLMGNGFRSTYTTRAFKCRYEAAVNAKAAAAMMASGGGGGQQMKRTATTARQFSSLHMCLGGGNQQQEELMIAASHAQPQRKHALASSSPPPSSIMQHQQMPTSHSSAQPDFAFPFNELMLWAVLTRRHEMAKLFWQYGEEPLAKALAAIRLYKCMSREAAHDYTELEVSNQLRECAQEFRECSLELLNHCHQQDQELTMRLLTAELPNWGNHACLSLAVIANNKRFLAHPCCQILLAELWHGGLRFRSRSNVKVVLGLLFPPSILLLDFKMPPNNTIFSSASSSSRPGSGAETAGSPLNEEEEAEEWENLLIRDNGNGVNSDENDFYKQHKQIRPRKGNTNTNSSSSSSSLLFSKFALFYSAPITSFWVWSLSFLLFMLGLIYVLLVEFPPEVPLVEWLLFVYVLALAMEHFRKLLVLEASSLVEKLRIFYNQYWNILTTVAVASYFVGFALRLDPQRMHSHGRVILAANSVLWHMKLFDFLSVHPRIGPYITMAGKMVLAMSYIIVLLMVTLMAFGVARQSITFPHEKWAWILVRNIFYKPYFMLYGEVYAGEIDTCGDEGTNCVPGHWIPPILMTVFLLIANILLINMLIAIFNNIFNVTNAMSQQVWMFQRYGQVLEYKSTPVLPPPLTPLAHLAMLARRCFFQANFGGTACCCPFHQQQHQQQQANARVNAEGDFALKVQLGPEELRELQDFEEDCMDDLSRRKYRLQQMCASGNGNGNNVHAYSGKNSNVLNAEGGDDDDDILAQQNTVVVEQQLQRLHSRIDQLGQAQQRFFELLLVNRAGKLNNLEENNISQNGGKEEPNGGNWPVKSEGKKKWIPRARVQPTISRSAPTAGSSGLALQFEQSSSGNNANDIEQQQQQQQQQQQFLLNDDEQQLLLMMGGLRQSSPQISSLLLASSSSNNQERQRQTAPNAPEPESGGMNTHFRLDDDDEEEEQQQNANGDEAMQESGSSGGAGVFVHSQMMNRPSRMREEEEPEEEEEAPSSRHRNHSVALGDELEQMFGIAQQQMRRWTNSSSTRQDGNISHRKT